PPTLHVFVKDPARFKVEHRSGLGPRAIPSTWFVKRVYCVDPTFLDQHKDPEELRDAVRIFADLLGGVDPRSGTKSEHESKGPEHYVAYWVGDKLGGPTGCARTASGQAAAPPNSVMNSRRFIRSPRQRASLRFLIFDRRHTD